MVDMVLVGVVNLKDKVRSLFLKFKVFFLGSIAFLHILYLLWLFGFWVSNVFWGVWVFLSFLLSVQSEMVKIIPTEARIIVQTQVYAMGYLNRFKEEHIRWMKRSAIFFVLALPVMYVLEIFLWRGLIYIPYIYFLYRAIIGYICFLLRKKPTGWFRRKRKKGV